MVISPMLLPPPSKFSGVPSLTQGIRYGEVSFSEPRLFPPTLLLPFQGIYVILVPDAAFSPRQFRLLYVGESGDVSKRLSDKHEKYNHWKREANGQMLYFAYCSTFGYTEEQRKRAEAEIISTYNPSCNTLLRSLLSTPVKSFL
jgi:hypothetical protein